MGLEYDQLYKKYQVDSLILSEGVDYTLMVEFYVSMFMQHLHWAQDMVRDIHIVTGEKGKHEAVMKYRCG